MIGFGIDQAKGLFFDSTRVRRAVDRASRKVLSRFGAHVRQSAKTSIRKRKKTSEPGRPPSSHTGLLRRFIFFGYDPDRQAVVIGPVRLAHKTGEALPALEHGGRSAITTRSRRRRHGRVRAVRTATIRARPFMGPALARERPKLPAMWRDSVRA
jgi:hypothetical protein